MKKKKLKSCLYCGGKMELLSIYSPLKILDIVSIKPICKVCGTIYPTISVSDFKKIIEDMMFKKAYDIWGKK